MHCMSQMDPPPGQKQAQIRAVGTMQGMFWMGPPWLLLQTGNIDRGGRFLLPSMLQEGQKGEEG